MSTPRTYYELLGIQPHATSEEIRRAYRQRVKDVHPDTAQRSGDDDLNARFQALQLAYETLLDPRRRQFYDAQLNAELARHARRAAFTLKLTPSHAHLQLIGEAQQLYVLAELKSAANYKITRPQLNLCLVLDRSLSMDGARLQQAKEAALYLIERMQPDDILSVVAFSDRARPVVQGQAGDDRTVAKTNVRNIQPLGGTELLQGLSAGLDELRKWRTPATLDHLILLTDGQTYGDEEGCLVAAADAAREKLGLTLLGLGADWNDQLLDEMAALSGGYSTFIDSPAKLVHVFEERFAELSNVMARNVQLRCHLNAQAQLQAVYRLTPNISRLPLDDTNVVLGHLEANRPLRVLMELLVSSQTLGAQRVMRVDASAELLGTNGMRDSAESELSVEFSDSLNVGEAVPREIDELLARIAVFKVQEKALAEAARGEHVRATARLQNLATHLLNFGEIELARAALLEAGELTRTGHLSEEGRKRIHYGTRNLSQGRAPADHQP